MDKQPFYLIAALLFPLLLIAILPGCTAQKLLDPEPATPTWIRIEPANPVLSTGGKMNFFATGISADGYEVVLPGVTWLVDEGTISTSGVYEAPAGQTVAMVSAAWENLRGVTTVDVKPAIAGDRLEIIPPDSFTVGFNYRLRARLITAGFGEKEVLVDWDAGFGTIDQSGLYKAPVRSQRDHITASYNELITTISFEVKHQQAILLWVKPSHADIPFDGGMQFTAHGVDIYNNIFPVEATFSTTDGIITRNGGWQPMPTTTSAIVKAEAAGIRGQATVSVIR